MTGARSRILRHRSCASEMLAIVVLNGTLDSSDLSLIPSLEIRVERAPSLPFLTLLESILLRRYSMCAGAGNSTTALDGEGARLRIVAVSWPCFAWRRIQRVGGLRRMHDLQQERFLHAGRCAQLPQDDSSIYRTECSRCFRYGESRGFSDL